jgi:O-acetyl-ADP-ribose deacetylase (regulator of RNase III)
MIQYEIGDATKPIVHTGTRVVAHVCNDQGGWGSGFVLALSNRWQAPEERYRKWSKEESFCLGDIQIVPVKDEHGRIYVANMVAQCGYATQENPVAISYASLSVCLYRLQKWIGNLSNVKMGIKKDYFPIDISIHMPRIGCGLAGGSWEVVGPLIEAHLSGFDLYVYDLPKDQERTNFDNLLQDVRSGKV